MDYKELLRAFLTKAYKMSDGDIDAILDASEATEETIVTALLAKDQTRIAALTKGKPGQTFQDGYKKAKKEVLEALEKEIKEKYGIEDEDAANPLTGLELIAKVIEKETPESAKAGAVTEETIKKHPVYIKLEKDSKKALKDLETDYKDQLDKKEKEFKKSQVFGSVSNKALELLEALNPVFSENPKVAATQRKDFLNELQNGVEFEQQDDGTYLLLDKDGKRMEDGHGNAISLEEFVKAKAENRFDFKSNNGGGNPGEKKDDKGKADKKVYPKGIQKPKTVEELAKLTNDKKISAEDRQIIMDTWEADNP